MRHGLFAILVCCFLWPLPSHAGPWLREEGTGFASLSFGATRTRDLVGTAYLEYGATAETTVGLDIGLHDRFIEGRKAYGTLFLRRSLTAPDAQHRWAYELGIGAVYAKDVAQPHIKTTLTWGKGVSLRNTPGWITVEGAVIWPLDGGDPITKLDSTIGLNFNDSTTGILQLNLAQQDSDLTGYLEPSLVITPKHQKFRIKIGTETPLDDLSATSLKLGLWHEF